MSPSEENPEKGSSLLTREERSSRLMEMVKDTTLRVQKEPEDLAFALPEPPTCRRRKENRAA